MEPDVEGELMEYDRYDWYEEKQCFRQKFVYSCGTVVYRSLSKWESDWRDEKGA